MILASLARVQNTLLYEYEKITTNIAHRCFPAPSKLFVPTTQKAYETFVDEFIVDELPLCTYQVLLGMLSSRLGIPQAVLDRLTKIQENLERAYLDVDSGGEQMLWVEETDFSITVNSEEAGARLFFTCPARNGNTSI